MDTYKPLTALDFAVMIVYVISIIVMGMWLSARKRKQDENLFLAERSLGWASIGFNMWGTNVGPSMLIASASIGYTTGIVAGNFSWFAIPFLLLLAMVFAPLYLKTSITTLPEFVGRRFNQTSREILAWYSLVTILVSWLGLNLYVSALLLSQITAWPLWASCLALAGLSVFLTVAGGLKTVAHTNVFQMLLIILTASVLTGVAFFKAGGLPALIQKVPADYWTLLKPTGDPTFPWYAIVFGYPVGGVWFWCTDQSMVQSVLGARNQRQGQLGANFTGWLKLLDVPLFILPGVLCFVIFPGLKNPDGAYMTLVSQLLPAGMTGLVVSVLVAGLVSTLASALNSLGAIFTLDLYVKHFEPGAQRDRIVWLGRVVALVGAVLAVLIALGISAIKGMDLFSKLQAILGFLAPPMTTVFLVGVLWRRATATAANVVMTFGSLACITVGVCYMAEFPSKAFWPHFMFLSFLLCLALCLLMVAVSLARPEKGDNANALTLGGSALDRERTAASVKWFWALLVLVTIGLYIFFN